MSYPDRQYTSYAPGDKAPPLPSAGSLMRLFQSEVFDAHLHMYYLQKMSATGVQDYLVNQLYRRSNEEIEFYLPQLCQLATMRMGSSSLHRYLMDKASTNTMFALKMHWFFQSIVEDELTTLRQAATRLWQDSEMAIVNSQEWVDWRKRSADIRKKIITGEKLDYLDAAEKLNPGIADWIEYSIRSRGFGPHSMVARDAEHATEAMDHLRDISASLQAAIQAETRDSPNILKTLGDPSASLQVMPDPMDFDDSVSQNGSESQNGSSPSNVQTLLQKQKMCEYHNLLSHFIALLIGLSNKFVGQEKEKKYELLAPCAHAVNQWLFERRCFVCLAGSPFSFMGLSLPIFQGDSGYTQVIKIHLSNCKFFSSRTRAPYILAYETVDFDEDYRDDQDPQHFSTVGWPASDVNPEFVHPVPKPDRHPIAMCVLNEFKQFAHLEMKADCQTLADAVLSTPDGLYQDGFREQCQKKKKPDLPEVDESNPAEVVRRKFWGESWEDKEARLRAASPYGGCASWGLRGAIAKGGDDCRQDYLACQIIRQFFAEAFSDKLIQAKQNFIESCAGYSLVSYFLQIKDRHNGNLLLDRDGHLIHIDFGFMISNSPGNVNWESSPFKLTQEILDVMGGEHSEQYEYFRTLIIRGFLEARKHFEKIKLLISMMMDSSSKSTTNKMPCFIGGKEAIERSLTDRFLTNITEEACIEKIIELIDLSVNNWRTVGYDNFQRITNGIL
eukprot:gene536-787_t